VNFKLKGKKSYLIKKESKDCQVWDKVFFYLNLSSKLLNIPKWLSKFFFHTTCQIPQLKYFQNLSYDTCQAIRRKTEQQKKN
jgi:hypothetical protein